MNEAIETNILLSSVNTSINVRVNADAQCEKVLTVKKPSIHVVLLMTVDEGETLLFQKHPNVPFDQQRNWYIYS